MSADTGHTKRLIDYIAWSWVTLIAVIVLLAVAALLLWGCFEFARWAFRHWDWLTVTILGGVAFTWWCGFWIQKSDRPPWCADKTDDPRSQA